ncbi:MAG TPA: DMT family transporter [Elusimicrobiota bacterium]|jgi:drug/metabolite transporter (DMT)-like permease|nr:DMT family transporter [Elusimicrobiota bacterium]
MIPMAALVADWVLTALWPLIGQSGLRYYSGMIFMWAGLAIGLVAMAPWLLARGRWRRMLARDAAPALLAMGFFSGLATAIYIVALNYTTPVNAVILAQIEVLYSALLSAHFLDERLSLKQSLASFLVVGGTALIVLHDLRSPRWRGDLMILATPWMYQVSHVFSKKLPADLDSMTLSGGRVFYGLITMAPLVAWSLLRGGAWSWEPSALSVLLAQGVLMSSLNLVLWYVAIRGMPLSKATTMLLSYPALTLVFSWGLGREAIRAVQLAGLACTFAGALWTARLSLERGEDGAVEAVPV